MLLVAVEYMCFMSVASSSEVFGLSGYYSSPSNQVRAWAAWRSPGLMCVCRTAQ